MILSTQSSDQSESAVACLPNLMQTNSRVYASACEVWDPFFTETPEIHWSVSKTKPHRHLLCVAKAIWAWIPLQNRAAKILSNDDAVNPSSLISSFDEIISLRPPVGSHVHCTQSVSSTI